MPSDDRSGMAGADKRAIRDAFWNRRWDNCNPSPKGKMPKGEIEGGRTAPPLQTPRTDTK